MYRGRRRQWVAGMRPDGDATLTRRHLPVEAAQHRRQDLTGEDDRLLLCLLAEFGDASPTLVAEVFSSIRRLDGVHMDRSIVVARVRATLLSALYFSCCVLLSFVRAARSEAECSFQHVPSSGFG